MKPTVFELDREVNRCIEDSFMAFMSLFRVAAYRALTKRIFDSYYRDHITRVARSLCEARGMRVQ